MGGEKSGNSCNEYVENDFALLKTWDTEQFSNQLASDLCLGWGQRTGFEFWPKRGLSQSYHDCYSRSEEEMPSRAYCSRNEAPVWGPEVEHEFKQATIGEEWVAFYSRSQELDSIQERDVQVEDASIGLGESSMTRKQHFFETVDINLDVDKAFEDMELENKT